MSDPQPTAHAHSHGHARATAADAQPSMDMLDTLDRTLAVVQQVADRVQPGQWADAAPCDDWTARDVANHLVQSNHWTLSLLSDGATPRPQGDAATADPAAELARTGAEVSAALRALDPGHLIASPFGEMPPSGFAAFLAVHILNHGWELAKATGQSTDLDPELSAALLGLAKRTIPGGLRPGAPFAPETEIVETAPAADRLAAYLGHEPRFFDHLGPDAARRAQGPSMVDMLGTAVAAAQQTIRRIEPGQWDLPTPCTEWTVRDVVAHLATGNHVVAEAFAGRPAGYDWQPEGDAAQAYAETARALMHAVEAPGAMTQTVALPYGEFPGERAAGLRLVDILSHTWDLAKATGQPTDFLPELNELALEMSRAAMQGRPRPAEVFAAEQPAPKGASAADRLAAFLGRTV